MKKQWEAPELEEMPVVILSLHQKWWQKMAAGEKVLELRKTTPQCKAPFRVLVYVTGGVGIVGEFGRQPAATGTDRRTGGRRLMEDRQKIIEKLVKIKALAERGVGGEQQTAQQMYEALKKRYGITDEEVNRAAVPVDISGIDLKKFWGISFRMALIVYSLNEEQKTCEMCRQVLLQEPECETCSTYKNTKGLQQQFEDLQRQLEKAAMEV